MTATAPSTRLPSLYELAGDQLQLQRQITEMAEMLDGADEREHDQAVSLLETILLADEQNREALLAKADAYCWVIDQLQAQAAYRKEQGKRLLELAAADEHRAERLEETLFRVLAATNPDATTFELPTHRLLSRRSVSVDVTAETMDLPDEYVRTKTTMSPDLTAIRKALQAGETVPGAALIERRCWRIA